MRLRYNGTPTRDKGDGDHLSSSKWHLNRFRVANGNAIRNKLEKLTAVRGIYTYLAYINHWNSIVLGFSDRSGCLLSALLKVVYFHLVSFHPNQN